MKVHLTRLSRHLPFWAALGSIGLLGLYAWRLSPNQVMPLLLILLAAGLVFALERRRSREHPADRPTSQSAQLLREETFERERFLVDTLMENIPDHIYFKDRDSHFIRINKSMAELFKLSSPAEALGKSDLDFFTAEHA